MNMDEDAECRSILASRNTVSFSIPLMPLVSAVTYKPTV
jgi:hypothetical protein